VACLLVCDTLWSCRWLISRGRNSVATCKSTRWHNTEAHDRHLWCYLRLELTVTGFTTN
jgi:hypothetical protein